MNTKTNLPVLSNEAGFYRYLHEINNIPSLTQEEEFMFAKSYVENGDIGAAHSLVTSHLKLVAKIALSYRNYGLSLVDIVSEGNLGLMQAVKKYNPDLGFRLSTYAMWWIKASIQEYILKSWSLVKIGTTASQKKLFFSLRKIKHKLTNLYSRAIGEQDFPEIARSLDVSVKDVAEMNKRLAGADLSLNIPIGDADSDTEAMDLIAETRPSHDIVMANREEKNNKHKMLMNGMKLLNDRELSIIRARRLQDEPSTLDSLSQQFNISKERVRQIENRAFEKLQGYVLSSSAGLSIDI